VPAVLLDSAFRDDSLCLVINGSVRLIMFSLNGISGCVRYTFNH